MLKTNVGNLDRLLRILIGGVLINLAIIGKIDAWGYIGIMPLLTGLMRTCPAYSLFGVNSCKNSAL